MAENGIIWVSYESLFYTEVFAQIDSFVAQNLNCIYLDENILWIGGDKGLFAIEGEGDSAKIIAPAHPALFEKKVWNIFADSSYVFICSEIGLIAKEKQTGKWLDINSFLPTQSQAVHCVSSDDKEVWIFQHSIATIIDKQTGNVNEIALPISIKRKAIMDKNNVFVASDKGLIHIERKGKNFRIISTTEGLPSTNTYDVIQKDGFLWIATDRGLVRFDWKNSVLF